MKYNKNHPIEFYTNFAEKEWSRLERTRCGNLIYHVHMDVFKRYIKNDHSVLELGAGAGRYSKDLVNMCKELIVSDITPKQLDINKEIKLNE